jgi:hypothetical protein
MTFRPLSRRTVLRGLGASIALPLLDVMIPRSLMGKGASSICSAATAGAAANTPTRMAFVFFPNGRWMPNWTPAQVGSDFSLPASLEPLAPVQNQLTVLSNLALDNAQAKGDGAGDHARSAATFLTGMHPYKTAGANIKLGISVDQVAAQSIGGRTRLPSLELGLEHGGMAGNCDSGYACAYVSNISWRSETTPMSQETDPAAVFEQLFGSDDPAVAKRLRFRQSILDTVADDAASLNSQLGQADRHKLDEFTTAVREIERRIEDMRNQKPILPPTGVKKPDGVPESYQEYTRLMYDMQVLAFQMDLTRISTFMTARDGSDHTYTELGLTEGHHTSSHHGNDPAKIEAVKKIDRFHMQQLSYFLQKLQSIREGDGTLLDHCMILAGSGISDGDRHNHNQLPILLAGRANGAFSPGRHIRCRGSEPLCNLYVSMLQAMDIKTHRFGDSTGPLTEVFA